MRGLRSYLSRIVSRGRAALRSAAVRFGGLPHTVGTVDSPPDYVAHDITGLWWRSLRSRAPIVDSEGGEDVSMTTHGRRLDDVWLAIESIGRGTVLPRRVILWLDDAPARLPWRLRRLRTRGLDIRDVAGGLGVHTKHWPYISTQPLEVPLVLADDDIIYPPTWLEGLRDRYAATEGRTIVAYRAHEIVMTSPDEFAPYTTWPPCDTAEPGYHHLFTAVSGVMLPPALLEAVKDAGTAFLELSPTNDDIWLHACAVREEIPVVQVAPHQQHWFFIPGSQTTGLNATNVTRGANDVQMSTANDALTRSRIWPSILSADAS